MKLKQIILISILLVILTIGAVSALQDNITDNSLKISDNSENNTSDIDSFKDIDFQSLDDTGVYHCGVDNEPCKIEPEPATDCIDIRNHFTREFNPCEFINYDKDIRPFTDRIANDIYNHYNCGNLQELLKTQMAPTTLNNITTPEYYEILSDFNNVPTDLKVAIIKNKQINHIYSPVLIDFKEDAYHLKSGCQIRNYANINKYFIQKFNLTDKPTLETQTDTQIHKVAKDDIKISLPSLKIKKSAKKLVLKVTLKDKNKLIKGKYVEIKFNKKTYNIKTNKKGIAKLTINKNILKKLNVGKTIKYQATYGKKTVSKSATVSK